MKNKINIAEILKNCPSGMELYSPLVGDCKFVKVHDYESKIIVELETGATVVFQTDGRYFDCPNAECILFPKGKTTWEGFVPPCQLEDGKIVATNNGLFIGIIKVKNNRQVGAYCSIDYSEDFRINSDYWFERMATYEEKQKLFQAIKDNGYIWNAETKTLEKLINPKFEEGNEIEKCGYRFTITEVKDDYYLTKCGNKIPIDYQDDFSLVPNKFDINTLKHFDKVLVRNTNKGHWCGQFYMFYDENEEYPFTCTYNCWKQCIPYNEDTKHLTGTTDDCDEYFKIWE